MNQNGLKKKVPIEQGSSHFKNIDYAYCSPIPTGRNISYLSATGYSQTKRAVTGAVGPEVDMTNGQTIHEVEFSDRFLSFRSGSVGTANGPWEII